MKKIILLIGIIVAMVSVLTGQSCYLPSRERAEDRILRHYEEVYVNESSIIDKSTHSNQRGTSVVVLYKGDTVVGTRVKTLQNGLIVRIQKK